MKRNKVKRILSTATAMALTTTTLAGGMTVAASEGTSVPAFEDIEFPDAMPASPTQAEDGYYDYDDMSVHYDLSFETYNYGSTVPDDDPIKAWLEEKYNVTLSFETVASADQETFLSTAFAGGDVPDLITLSSKEMGFTLGGQGLLVDAKDMYPYMPQTQKFVTKTLLQYSTMEDGTIPFVTKYAIQDGDIWNLAIRQDWLDNLGMEMPTTEEELLEYAKACTFNDPDGNGQDDTYFMLGAGGGSGLGMLDGFGTAYGNPNYTVGEDGKLSAPMLNGTRKQTLEFINKLCSEGVLPVDWYSIEWEQAKSYTLNDKIGMVRYPASNLYQEYVTFQGNDASKAANWTFLPSMPFENGKGGAGGNPGVLLAIPKSNVEGDDGKLMRICHILDAMVYGGEAYFQTIQGGGLDVYPDYDGDVREYKEDGRSFCYVSQDHPGFNGTYGTDNLALAPWQNFGYTLKWQDEYAESEEAQPRADAINNSNAALAEMDRWENTGLLYTLPAEIQPNLNEFVSAQEYKFATGERSFDEWDTYVNEWLDQGGRENIKAVAEQLGCELPDGIE